MWDAIFKKVVPGLIKEVTPELRTLLEEVIYKLRDKARKTDNPADDWLVALLATCFGIKFKG